nr:MAG TPA: hypothetical protein [Caudoviricetes sp.]
MPDVSTSFRSISSPSTPVPTARFAVGARAISCYNGCKGVCAL